jgi:glycosyltransferase involved in cell wall biosynthesis
MRILIASDQYPPMVGGVPTVTRSLAAGLAGRGHAVAVLAPAQGWRPGTGSDGAAQVHYLGSVPWPWYAGARLARVPVRALAGLMGAFRPDVVHVHSPLVLGVLARRRAARLGAPVVYTNHYLPVNVSPSAGRPPRALDAAFYACVVGFANRCSEVTAPSATALRLLADRGLRAPSRVISNGADLGTFAPGPADERLRDRYRLPRDRPLILTVSRLSPEKRIPVLLAAAARLTGPGHLVIAGTGPQQSRLRAEALRGGLAGRVSFLGFVPGADLPGLYRLADVFAIASEAELQGLSTMDAMASALPVVAPDAGALAELVADGRNGFLVGAGRADQMAARLDALTASPALRAAMAAESVRRIRGHDRRLALAEWESLYGALAARRPGRRQ